MEAVADSDEQYARYLQEEEMRALQRDSAAHTSFQRQFQNLGVATDHDQQDHDNDDQLSTQVAQQVEEQERHLLEEQDKQCALQLNDEEMARKLEVDEAFKAASILGLQDISNDRPEDLSTDTCPLTSALSDYPCNSASGGEDTCDSQEDADALLAQSIHDRDMAYKMQMEADAVVAASIFVDNTGHTGGVAGVPAGGPAGGFADSADGDPQTDPCGARVTDVAPAAQKHRPWRGGRRRGGGQGRWQAASNGSDGGLVTLPPQLQQRDNFRPDDYEALWELAEQLGEAKQAGLTEEEMRLLPTCMFGGRGSKQSAAAAGVHGETGGDEDEQCKVCFSDLEGHNIRTLPCCHHFHTQCIDKWLKEKAVCPICRVDIKEELKKGKPSTKLNQHK